LLPYYKSFVAVANLSAYAGTGFLKTIVILMLFTTLFIWGYKKITHSDELEGLL